MCTCSSDLISDLMAVWEFFLIYNIIIIIIYKWSLFTFKYNEVTSLKADNDQIIRLFSWRLCICYFTVKTLIRCTKLLCRSQTMARYDT